MRRFKLIKEYPLSPPLGFVLGDDPGDYSYDSDGGFVMYDLGELSNSPEFWEEVKAPITELKRNGKYKLQYSGMYCHAAIIDNSEASDKDARDLLEEGKYEYIGDCDSLGVDEHRRLIFKGCIGAKLDYVMFSDDRLDFIKEEI